jgi:hypothetical protein
MEPFQGSFYYYTFYPRISFGVINIDPPLTDLRLQRGVKVLSFELIISLNMRHRRKTNNPLVNAIAQTRGSPSVIYVNWTIGKLFKISHLIGISLMNKVFYSADSG